MSPSQLQTMPAVYLDSRPVGALRILASSLLFLLVFTIPWEDQFVLAGIGTVSRAVGIAAFGAGMLAVLTDGRLRVARPVHLALLLFVLWSFLSVFWTVDIDSTRAALQTYIQLMGLAWLIFELAPAEDGQLNLLRAYTLGTFVSAGGTLYSYWFDFSSYWQRHVAAGFDPNDLCVILAISIPMSVYLMTVDTSALRWLWPLHPLVILFAAFLTASRGGMMAMAAALVIVPLMFRNFAFVVKLALIPAVLVAGLSIAAYAPPETFERLASIPQEISRGTFGERGSIWRAGGDLFRQHPAAGVGLGAFAPAVAPELGEKIIAHNTFLTVLVETGMVGFALFCSVLFFLFDRLYRLAAPERRLWTALLLTWFTGAMSLSWAHRKPTWFLFSLLAAASSTAVRMNTFRHARSS